MHHALSSALPPADEASAVDKQNQGAGLALGQSRRNIEVVSIHSPITVGQVGQHIAHGVIPLYMNRGQTALAVRLAETPKEMNAATPNAIRQKTANTIFFNSFIPTPPLKRVEQNRPEPVSKQYPGRNEHRQNCQSYDGAFLHNMILLDNRTRFMYHRHDKCITRACNVNTCCKNETNKGILYHGNGLCGGENHGRGCWS